MIKVGQVYFHKRIEAKIVITYVDEQDYKFCDWIVENGKTCIDKIDWIKQSCELIAEYPTWQEAVNSKEFKVKMKCEKCKYCQYDWADDMYLCRFGWEDEDSKGNCGCRYNQKTLDRKYKTLLEEEQKEATEFYEDFCKFMELKQDD